MKARLERENQIRLEAAELKIRQEKYFAQLEIEKQNVIKAEQAKVKADFVRSGLIVFLLTSIN